MKKTIIFFLIVFKSLSAFCQKHDPHINFGFSYPIFFKSSLYNDNKSQTKTGISGANIFIEKANLITFPKYKNFSLTPGIIYSFYTEEKKSPSSALGGDSSASYKHKSLGIYAKLLYELTSFSSGKAILYTGVFTGINIYTSTKGHESRRRYTDPPYNWSSETDGSGKLFFNLFTGGLLIGAKPRYNSNVYLQPAFELTFFPYYAKLLDIHNDRKDITKSNSMLSATIILNIDIKKAAQQKRP